VRLRLILLLALAVATAQAADAAPAPLSKSARHPPSPDTLLANFRAEGYDVRKIERGPEPGTYVLSTAAPVRAGRRLGYQIVTHTVRADGPDVRAPLREVLERDRQLRQAALDSTLEQW
jgi:hypothetical protein